MAKIFGLAVVFLHLLHVDAKSLWSTQPANFTNIIQNAYPVGNGQLAILPFGLPGQETLNLNRDSLWSGGPFQSDEYIGGNPDHSVASALPGIRSWIFENGTGNATALMGNDNWYGSYAVLGNLSVTIHGIESTKNYKRALDLSTGIHTTTFISGHAEYTSKVYCSYPDSVCVYDLSSTSNLPEVGVQFDNVQSDPSLVSASCSTKSASASLDGITQADIGMIYKAEARLVGSGHATSCSKVGRLSVKASPSRKSLTLVIAAGTDYDETMGTAAANFSFRGKDPGSYVQSTAEGAAAKSPHSLLQAHLADYSALANAFTLDLPDTAHSAGLETSELIGRYNLTGAMSSDPYLESLQFDFGRHLFISSSRDNSLPPNLQGKWAYSLENAWGADYHADINLQMNHWGVDQTGLGDLQTALWNYMIRTWAPRGAETAELLYNAPGWVVHDEINTFGYTGMKTGDDYWADYPASAAWMMLQVADHFDYSQDVHWLKTMGYPQLLKPVAQFWLSQLQEDEYFKDGTLVVNPCNSPEHGPTTFGCTHYQQLLYSLFTNILQSAPVVSEPSTTFLASVTHALHNLDKGLHIGSWNQIQEWKLDLDVENDTHRHLSNLVGWYPGPSLSSYLSGYSNATIQSSVATTLWSRGPGIADANAGWEKVWRGACWARLNETERAYYELRLTIQENIVDNLLSMYSGKYEPFQIDANFGYVGAVLSMLVVDLPQGLGVDGPRTVVLGPAIPAEWGNGRVIGLRVRGGEIVDFNWDGKGIVRKATMRGGSKRVRLVNVLGDVVG